MEWGDEESSEFVEVGMRGSLKIAMAAVRVKGYVHKVQCCGVGKVRAVTDDIQEGGVSHLDFIENV